MSVDTVRSDDVLELHRRYLFPGVRPYYGDAALVVDRAHGRAVWDVEGRAYLDFYGDAMAVSIGHANEEIHARIVEQLRRAQPTSEVYVSEGASRLAQRLAAVTPGRLERCVFTSSGAEATAAAVAAARWATGHQTVVTLHGAGPDRGWETTGTAAFGSPPSVGASGTDLVHVRNPERYRAPQDLDEDGLVELCIGDFERTLATLPGGRIAAFLVEPVQGAVGFTVVPRTYLRRLAPRVREAGGLLIVDESRTGWGRAGGALFGVEHAGVEPDIMTFAEGMANGAPIGCAIATSEVAEAVSGAPLPAFRSDPVSVTAALATLDIVERLDLPDNALRQGLRLRAHLQDAALDHPCIGDVRGVGLMQALEIVAPDGSKTPDPARAEALLLAAKQQGLLIGLGGLHRNVLRIAPPLTVDAKEIDDGCGRLTAALRDLA